MPGAKLTSLSHFGLAIESSLGTPVAATAWVPVLKFTPQDIPDYVPDTGFRGVATRDFGQYLGVESSTYDLEGDFFPLSGGNLLAAIFGTDTVSGTAAPYTHTLTMAPYLPSYTLSDFYSAGARQFPGARLEKLVLKFTPEAGVTYTANFLGFPSVVYTPGTTRAYETEAFFLGWEGAITLGGAADANLSSFTLTLTRDKSKVLWSAQNSQKPYDVFMGPFVAQWDVEYYMLGDSEYATALTQATQAVVATITEPGTGNVLTLQSSAVQWTKPTIDRAQDYVVVRMMGDAVHNATDGGPILAKLANTVSTSYTSQAAS